MPQKHPFTIYNASAGSGKTYTLVKEYLKLLFQSDNLFHFKRILAITFTNKAVAEMKERIIDTLKKFTTQGVAAEYDSMFEAICEELQMEPEALQKKSETILNSIVHNYAAFDISTIDGFTHRLIRTFAHDLKLPLNFEVELDQDALLNEAVDSLISKAGTYKELTKVLVDFAIEKADNDKSWDVSFDFNKIAKLLVKENDMAFVEQLKDKTLDDFKALKVTLRQEVLTVEKAIIENAQQVLTLIEEAGLEHSDFSRGTLPNHFKKVLALNLNKLYDNKLEENISERKSIYNKSLSPELATTIDALLPDIETLYKRIKAQVFHLKFLKTFYKNVTPISVLNAINNELIQIKGDQNKMLISEFNTIISKEIKAQPTPFIYERMGEKFNHYFIDEFQDTSVMQWENLIPLLGNSLAAEGGSVMLVGDAKQAIYRWRGGKAEQFMGLFSNENPFHVKKHVESLASNFRSFKAIVNFNNGFFKFLAHRVFKKEDYQRLYQNAYQKPTQDKEGYVELSFLNIEKEDDRHVIFPEKVFEKLNSCLDKGFQLNDICVLVRKKKEGVAIANYLSQQNIPIISSETLLINNAPEVVFINNLLTLLVQPENNEIKIKVLDYLTELFNIEDKHEFFIKHINLKTEALLQSLESYNVYVSGQQLLQLPLYDLLETIIRSFNLVTSSNAYVQFYLDEVLDFSQKKGSDISGFLDYFEKKKEHLSIVSSKGQNAVQIMTIHKSKGLEFPVVIFPYADLDIYRELEPKEWFKIDREKYNGFSNTLLNYSKDFEFFGEEGQAIYNRHQSELELDHINLIYVALTRAIEQLYVISTNDISPKGIVNEKKYSGLLLAYLQDLGAWNNLESTYVFGNPENVSKRSKAPDITQLHNEFISTSKEAHNIKVITKSGYLWDTNQQEAIEKGNLIHNIMSQIITVEDVGNVINDFVEASLITAQQALPLKETILYIVNHPELQDYFSSKYTIYTEHDIITKTGIILRPDRVVINAKHEAVIIDYKTGAEDKTHQQQLQVYQDVLEDMKISVKKKILIYVNDDIKIKDV
ncbi:UvrD-helicase domain-containing protein [Tamlana sp. 2201CG12-4]|uniref:UvrD-helicase domain-containing protein n=1 Tax=Tamlana sp. 2201CG12-4 TaxID=3112582 RepID=UPI002DBF25DF|nr:UvrD-helicase domain-containing protein [Tamlana sp. 2201CG12-4]MEC3906024.1 UvrD-helicase domain-containing protein [Tamlana sp. 2201CG12-4]